MKKFFCIFIFILTIINCAQRISWAQLVMEQSRVELEVNPGDTVIDKITLHNQSQRVMEIKIYWQDFQYLPPFDGKKEFLPAGTLPNSMAKWISYTPQEIRLEPQTKKDIKYTIKVPANAKGGFNGVLFFEEGNPRKTVPTETGVALVTRLGALFFINTTNKNKSVQMDTIDLRDSYIIGSLTNSGDFSIFPKGIYYLMNKEGIVVDRGEIKKIYLPPQKTANFEFSITDKIQEGDYTAVVTFDLSGGDSLVKEMDFKKESDASLKMIEVRD